MSFLLGAPPTHPYFQLWSVRWCKAAQLGLLTTGCPPSMKQTHGSMVGQTQPDNYRQAARPTIRANLCASATRSVSIMTSSSWVGKAGSFLPIRCSMRWKSSTSYLWDSSQGLCLVSHSSWSAHPEVVKTNPYSPVTGSSSCHCSISQTCFPIPTDKMQSCWSWRAALLTGWQRWLICQSAQHEQFFPHDECNPETHPESQSQNTDKARESTKKSGTWTRLWRRRHHDACFILLH